MGFWDTLSSCFWFNPEYLRNTVASAAAGFLFFTGWWFLIDAIAMYASYINAAHIVLGILGTISLIMVNSVSRAQMNGDSSFSGGCLESRGARIWIFVGFVIGFAAIIASIWVMVANTASKAADAPSWPGVSLLLQNIFIFTASLVYKFGRSEDVWN